MTVVKSFFRTMLEEKGLDEQVIEVQHNEITHMVEVSLLIELIDSTSVSEREVIELTMRKIDFLNGDMMDYMNHLAKCFIKNNY